MINLYREELKAIYKPIMEESLKEYGYVISRSACALGVNKSTFTKYIKLYGIEVQPSSYHEAKETYYGDELDEKSTCKIVEMLERYLSKHEGNINRMAKELGMTWHCMRNILKRYGLYKNNARHINKCSYNIVTRRKKVKKDSIVRARIDKELKESVAKILQEIGINESTAIRLLYAEILKRKAIPFKLEIKK